jgi:hypothetical protein
MEPGGLVGPDDDLAAVARGGGVGVEGHVGADKGAGGVANGGVAALIVAADENRAAAGRTGSVDTGVADEADALAGDLNVAADARSGGVNAAADEHIAPALPLQTDVATGKSAVVRDGDRIKIARRQHGGAAAGVDGAGVGHRSARGRCGGRVGAAGIDKDAAAVLTEQHLIAGDQANETAGGNDGAGVGDRPADEGHHLAADRAGVIHLAGQPGEPVQSGEKILLRERAAHRIQAADIDHGSLAEIDTGGIHQVNLAVGQQGAVDLGGSEPADQIEHARLGAGLDELHGLAGADIKGAPAQHGVVLRRDGRLHRGRRDGRMAGHDGTAGRLLGGQAGGQKPAQQQQPGGQGPAARGAITVVLAYHEKLETR